MTRPGCQATLSKCVRENSRNICPASGNSVREEWMLYSCSSASSQTTYLHTIFKHWYLEIKCTLHSEKVWVFIAKSCLNPKPAQARSSGFINSPIWTVFLGSSRGIRVFGCVLQLSFPTPSLSKDSHTAYLNILNIQNEQQLEVLRTASSTQNE